MRWDPTQDSFFAPQQRGGWSPRVELKEDPEHYLVQAELPGCKKEDIKVTLEGDTLTIRGEKKEEEKREDENVHVYERSYGSFTRSFRFPSAVDAEQVSAETSDGVLSVRVKKAEQSKSRTVEIKST
tara:strand:- start:627 stop:1007 length:381 start_codon:yes stop_codon:yes gene_type:complete